MQALICGGWSDLQGPTALAETFTIFFFTFLEDSEAAIEALGAWQPVMMDDQRTIARRTMHPTPKGHEVRDFCSSHIFNIGYIGVPLFT